MPEDMRRFPAVERAIGDLTEKDIRIRIIGTIIDRQESFVIVDDSTGKIKVTLPEGSNVDGQKTVRVFGRVMPAETGLEIQGEIIQDMSGLSLDLLQKTRGMGV